MISLKTFQRYGILLLLTVLIIVKLWSSSSWAPGSPRRPLPLSVNSSHSSCPAQHTSWGSHLTSDGISSERPLSNPDEALSVKTQVWDWINNGHNQNALNTHMHKHTHTPPWKREMEFSDTLLSMNYQCTTGLENQIHVCGSQSHKE